MPIPIFYNKQYVPSPIAPEGIPTVVDTATVEDLTPAGRELLERYKKSAKERTKREELAQRGYTTIIGEDGKEHYIRSEQPLQSEDHLFALGLAGGIGTAQTAQTMGWVPAIASDIGGTVVGTAGGAGGYKLGSYIDNKYGTNTTPYLTFFGGLTGGVVGGYAVARSTPMMTRTMLHQAKNMDWTPEGVIVPDKAPKWRWSKNAQYDHTSKTLELPLFARKSQIAHELGHYVGDMGVTDPAMVKGAFIPGYKYSDNASFELNSAEAFADHFKTKLGYPYKGSNENLVSRQNALNDDIEFYDVTRDGARSYELPWEEKLGIPKGERNRPAKVPTKNQTYKKTTNLDTDKDYIDDVQAIQDGILGKTNLDSEHKALLDWFNSPQYKERLVKQGFNEDQINKLLSDISDKMSSKNLKYVKGLNSIRDWGFTRAMRLKVDPQLHPAYEAMTNGDIKIGEHPMKWSLIQLKKGVDLDEVLPHEVGGHHTESLVTKFNAPYTSQQITDIGKKATISSGLPEGYYPSWWETRARALTIAKQMREAGWNPNSPEQVNVWLNKHLLKDTNTNVVQGALYYDRPMFIKAVSEGLKKGGKINGR